MKRRIVLKGLPMKITAISAIVAMMILATLPVQVSAAPPAAGGDGEVIFNQKCIACHTLGGGTLVGPDLSGVTNLRDVDWLTRWLSAPDKMLADGDPIATELLQEFNNIPMPNLGLTDAEVSALIAYLQTQTGTESAATVAQPEAVSQPEVVATPAIPGNANTGSKLFIGESKLSNGGPACISCHSVDVIRSLGGGTLGPNLTHVYDRYGDAGLSAALNSLPFPTMQGVFADKPLTENEAVNLKEFLYQSNSTKQGPVEISGFILLGILGMIIFLVISHIVWIKRLDGVRKPLVGR